MICYLFLTWDNKVVIWAGAFIFCVGNQLAGATPNLEEKNVFLWVGVPLLPGPPWPPSQWGPTKDPLPQISERREGKALTQDSEVGIWAEALILFLRTGSRGRRLTLGKKFFPMVIRPAPPGPAKAPLTVGANQSSTHAHSRGT